MSFLSLLRRAATGIVIAVGAVVITFFIADLISGPLMATQPGADAAEEVPVAGAAIGTIFGGLVGMVLAFAASRIAWSTVVFVGVCLVALVLYGLFAWSAADTQSTGVWLNVMHLAAAVPIMGQLIRWLGEQPAPTPATDTSPSTAAASDGTTTDATGE